jgi:hypothetical protein
MKMRMMLAVLASLALLVAGCGTLAETTNGSTIAAGNTAAQTGYVKFLVTDAPPDQNVTSIMLTVSGLSVHMAGTEDTVAPPATTATTTSPNTTTTTPAATTTAPATTGSTATGTEPPESSGSGSGWITIPISGPNPFDLLKLQGIDELLGTSQLAAGRYTQIRLNIDKAEVSLGGGALQEATVPSGELKFVTPFDVIAGVTTDVKLDFDAQKSVTVTGNNKVMIKPVVKLAISNENTIQLASVTGAVSAVNTASSTISILADGATAPVVLTIDAQTVIILDEEQTALSDLAALPSGTIATASYDKGSLKAVRIEMMTPAPAATTAASA